MIITIPALAVSEMPCALDSLGSLTLFFRLIRHPLSWPSPRWRGALALGSPTVLKGEGRWRGKVTDEVTK
jgi:hypothetical protein